MPPAAPGCCVAQPTAVAEGLCTMEGGTASVHESSCDQSDPSPSPYWMIAIDALDANSCRSRAAVSWQRLATRLDGERAQWKLRFAGKVIDVDLCIAERCGPLAHQLHVPYGHHSRLRIRPAMLPPVTGTQSATSLSVSSGQVVRAVAVRLQCRASRGRAGGRG